MERSGITRFATNAVVATFVLMSVSLTAAPVLAQTSGARRPAALAAPANFKATPGGDHIALTWDAVSGASSYTIYRGTSSHGETLYYAGVTSAFFNNTSHVTKGAIYYYEVAAVDGHGVEGARSAESASSTDAVVSPSAPSATHPPTSANTSPVSGTVWWALLGIISLAALVAGIILFARQHQRQMEPLPAYDDSVPQQSGVFVAPQHAMPTNPRVAAETFPPREWNEMSPDERAGISGIFTPPEQENYGRQLGAVAFWDEQSEQGNPPPRERAVERHQWSYPDPPPSWPPPERGR